MDIKGAHSYREQTIHTMTQEELLLLVYDELVVSLRRADLALTKGEEQPFDNAVERCLAIIRYLDDTLDRQYPIGNDLHRLYDYFCYELIRVKMGRNKKELDQVRPMITELRDSFRMAAKNKATQNSTGGNPTAGNPAVRNQTERK